ncbi:hypothetical protein [Oceanobacillus kimchii]|uniref:hypothetical protein n=1 Tax=Oceanobacillus kimchii TaxID=746691 RepID=UPI0009852F29|nr:hypothetical protein [Oceanobacillus kimchii]
MNSTKKVGGLNFTLSFIVFSTITLVVSTMLKVKLNLDFDPVNREVILKIISLPFAIIALSLVNVFVVFISAFGTNLFLNIVSNVRGSGNIQNSDFKTNIYLIYIIGHSLLNLTLVLYIVMSENPVQQMHLNLTSLLFYFILSIFIYFVADKLFKQKELLISIVTVFFLNGIMPIIFILNNVSQI